MMDSLDTPEPIAGDWSELAIKAKQLQAKRDNALNLKQLKDALHWHMELEACNLDMTHWMMRQYDDH